jgi:hypothetical protein
MQTYAITISDDVLTLLLQGLGKLPLEESLIIFNQLSALRNPAATSVAPAPVPPPVPPDGVVASADGVDQTAAS